jgi:hypothetical protein
MKGIVQLSLINSLSSVACRHGRRNEGSFLPSQESPKVDHPPVQEGWLGDKDNNLEGFRWLK